MIGKTLDERKQEFRIKVGNYRKEVEIRNNGVNVLIKLGRELPPPEPGPRNEVFQKLVEALRDYYGVTNDCKLMSENREAGRAYKEKI